MRFEICPKRDSGESQSTQKVIKWRSHIEVVELNRKSTNKTDAIANATTENVRRKKIWFVKSFGSFNSFECFRSKFFSLFLSFFVEYIKTAWNRQHKQFHLKSYGVRLFDFSSSLCALSRWHTIRRVVFLPPAKAEFLLCFSIYVSHFVRR